MPHTLMTQTLNRISFPFPLVLAVAALTGCAVGPNYKRPTVDIPGLYRGPTADSPVTADAKPLPGLAERATESLSDAKWWEVFQDPETSEPDSHCTQEYYDVRIAATRVLQAQAQLGITRADQLPSLKRRGQCHQPAEPKTRPDPGL